MILNVLLGEVGGVISRPHILPDTQMLGRAVHANRILLTDVVRVNEIINAARIVDERPQRNRALLCLELETLGLAVEEEGTEFTGIDMLVQSQQEGLVELEGGGVLLHDLVQAVQPENEHGRALLVVCITIILTKTSAELMTKRAPLLLHEYLESLESTVVRIQHELCSSNHLCSTIPAITSYERKKLE